MKAKLMSGWAIFSILLIAGTALADSAAGSEPMGLGVIIFLVFLAGIVFFQLIPGLVLFGSLLVALFKRIPAGGRTTVSLTSDDAGEIR